MTKHQRRAFWRARMSWRGFRGARARVAFTTQQAGVLRMRAADMLGRAATERRAAACYSLAQFDGRYMTERRANFDNHARWCRNIIRDAYGYRMAGAWRALP